MRRGLTLAGVLLFTVTVAAILFTGCGKKNAAPTPAPTPTAKIAPSATATAKPSTKTVAPAQAVKPPAQFQSILDKSEQAMAKIKGFHADVKATMGPGELALMEQTLDAQPGVGWLGKIAVIDQQTGKPTNELQILVKGNDTYVIQPGQTTWTKAPAEIADQITQSMSQFSQFGFVGVVSSFAPLLNVAAAWDNLVDEAVDGVASDKISYTVSQDALGAVLSGIIPGDGSTQDALKGLQMEGKGTLWIGKSDSLLRRALVEQTINFPGMGKVTINVDARYSNYDKPITLPNP